MCRQRPLFRPLQKMMLHSLPFLLRPTFHTGQLPEPIQPTQYLNEWNEFGTSHDVAPQATKQLLRRKSMMNLSNLNLSNRFPNPISVSCTRSLFSIMQKKNAPKDKRGLSPKLIPGHIASYLTM
jgi:hypothetical protein